MNIFRKKTLLSAFTVNQQKIQILSWWRSDNQGKHFENVISDKSSFFSSF